MQLLDDHVALARRAAAGSLAATALRTRSREMRHVLAHAAGDGAHDLDGWLRTARERRVTDVPAATDPAALAELAGVVALQHPDPDATADGLALYALAVDRFGPAALPAEHQQLYAELAHAAGDRRRTRTLLETCPDIPQAAHAALSLDLDNPFVRPGQLVQSGQPSYPGQVPAEEWLSRLRTFALPGYPELRLDGAAPTPFDRVTAGYPRPPTGERSRVSVVVTSFCPGTALLTAVRSLLHQTWGDLEILVVDDGSPDAYAPVLEQCQALDDHGRVELIRLPRNRGVYHARNVGLDAACGAVVAFQDQDDWSHPLRMEHQARPLLHGDTVVATRCDGLCVSPDLSLTRPGRPPVSVDTSSLMLRRERVRARVGYFDPVRRAADTEYTARIEAAFGRRGVQRLAGYAYTLVRRTAQSLSAGDFHAGWVHPARVAYQGAYGLWHRRVADGAADGYVPPEPGDRPFPAPPALGSAGARVRDRAYDVVLAGDWREYGGIQKSMVEEIRALTARGMRVGVLQLETLRFVTGAREPLCQPVQELINAGTVDELLLTDDAVVSLLMVRYPPVLQFPPPGPAQLRVQRVLVLANQAPCGADGTDLRYVPHACTEAARRLFGVTPQWCPQGPQVRAVLRGRLGDAPLTSFDLPAVVEPADWAMPRVGFRAHVPVLGRHSRDSPAKWPADRATLTRTYPVDHGVDVRVLGGARTAHQLLGTPRLPANWLVYAYDELAVRDFLYQLDFYVYFPHPGLPEAFGRAALEALASGCVTILPPAFAETFGDAAVYCAPQQVRSTVDVLYADPERYREQSARAAQRVAQRFSHDSHAEQVRALLPGAGDSTGAGADTGGGASRGAAYRAVRHEEVGR